MQITLCSCCGKSALIAWSLFGESSPLLCQPLGSTISSLNARAYYLRPRTVFRLNLDQALEVLGIGKSVGNIETYLSSSPLLDKCYTIE